MGENKKTTFFFDDSEDIGDDQAVESVDAGADEKFFPSADPVVAEKERTYSEEFTADKQAVKEAVMKEITDEHKVFLEVAFGPYQNNYGVHITPKHAKRNLSTDRKVFLAIEQAMIILNEYVPKALTVEIHPPRQSWKMKVISFVVLGGATAWNFDIEKFEREGAPRIYEAVQKVILS